MIIKGGTVSLSASEFKRYKRELSFEREVIRLAAYLSRELKGVIEIRDHKGEVADKIAAETQQVAVVTKPAEADDERYLRRLAEEHNLALTESDTQLCVTGYKPSIQLFVKEAVLVRSTVVGRYFERQ